MSLGGLILSPIYLLLVIDSLVALSGLNRGLIIRLLGAPGPELVVGFGVLA